MRLGELCSSNPLRIPHPKGVGTSPKAKYLSVMHTVHFLSRIFARPEYYITLFSKKQYLFQKIFIFLYCGASADFRLVFGTRSRYPKPTSKNLLAFLDNHGDV